MCTTQETCNFFDHENGIYLEVISFVIQLLH